MMFNQDLFSPLGMGTECEKSLQQTPCYRDEDESAVLELEKRETEDLNDSCQLAGLLFSLAALIG